MLTSLNLWLTRIAVLVQAFCDPILNPTVCIFNVAAFGSAANNGFERRPRNQIDLQARIEQVAIARIADYKPIFPVVANKAFGNTFNCVYKASFASLPCLFCAPQRCDVVKPKKPFAASDCYMAAVIRYLHVRDQ